MTVPNRSPKNLTRTHCIFVGFSPGIGAGRLFGTAILPLAPALQKIFLHLLKMAIVPLVAGFSICSVLSPISSATAAGQ